MTQNHDEAQGSVRWGTSQVKHARIPDWVLYAKISDRAVRVYAVLGRYADGDGKSFPSKTKLCGELHCTRPTLDAAITDLVSTGALIVRRRSRPDGSQTSNEYVLNWAEDLRVGASELGGTPPGTLGGQEERVPEVTITKETDVSIRSHDEPPADKRVEVIGKKHLQSLPFNALAEQCGVDPEGRRREELTYALWGKRNSSKKLLTPGITHLFWTEVLRYDETNGTHFAEEFHYDPVKYAMQLERQIMVKVDRYRARMPEGTILTPTALAKWWLDLEALVGSGDARIVSADEVRALAQREREL